MSNRSRSHRPVLAAGGVLVLAISLLVAVLGSTASGSETPPENTALPTISPTAPYAGQVATATRGTWTGEPTSYSYSWSRCGYTCETIAGATEKKYTPVEADVGKNLTVSVTATNGAGGTTAVSVGTAAVKQALQWYRCGPMDSESAVYEDANCTVKGALKFYSWLPANTGTVVTAGTSPYRLTYNMEGVSFEYNCEGSQGSGQLAANPARAEIQEYKPTLESCTVAKPAGKGCEISGGKITFNSLKGKSPESPETLNPELKVESSSGTALASYELVKCTTEWFNGAYSLVGWFPGQIENSSMITPYGPMNNHLQVYRKGKLSDTSFLGGSSINYKSKGGEIQPLKLSLAP
jgi:hypothetical protein